MDILTYSNAFAQDEYRIPCYIPKHSVRIVIKYAEFSTIMLLLLRQMVQYLAVLLRKT